MDGGNSGGFVSVLLPGPLLISYDFFENVFFLLLKPDKKLKKFLFLGLSGVITSSLSVGGF